MNTAPDPATSPSLQSISDSIAALQQQVSALEQRSGPTIATQQTALLAVLSKIRESLDLAVIFRLTAQELRPVLQVDRVAIYQFEADSGYSIGKFVAEDSLPGFDSVLAAQVEDHCFGEKLQRNYNYRQAWACADVHQAGLPPCHLGILQRFQVRANLVVPLFRGAHLWGLLCVHHCATPHAWSEVEIEFVRQIAIHLGIALQHADYVQQLQRHTQTLEQAVAQAVKQEQAVVHIIDHMRRSLDIQTIFNTVVDEVRQLLNCHRAVVYRFNPDWSGSFVAEAIATGWTPLMEWQTTHPELNQNISHCSVNALRQHTPATDSYLQAHEGGVFANGQVFRVCADIYAAEFTPCYLRSLEGYQARAYAIVAIYCQQQLWGLLAVFQNDGPRQWTQHEVTFLCQIGGQLGVAIYQADLLAQTQQRADQVQTTLTRELEDRARRLAIEAQQERALAQVVDKIRRSLDLDTIFHTATGELRQLLAADRVVILGSLIGLNARATGIAPDLTPSLSGQVVAESVLPQYAALLGQPLAVTGLWPLQGGKPTPDNIAIVPDIDRLALSTVQQQALGPLRAALVLPLLQGEDLWGLLCVHQCGTPRPWPREAVGFAGQIATHLGVAIQQAELLAQTEAARATADGANRAKSQFLAHMSHELRTPMNSILGFAQLLLRQDGLTPHQQTYLEAIFRSGEHLLTLLEDVLAISKIEAHQVQLNPTTVDLARLVTNLAELFQLKAQDKGLVLTVEWATALPRCVCTDESKLRQVLVNLVGNAIKFTQQGRVGVRLWSSSPWPLAAAQPLTLVAEVTDTGPGIAPAELGQLFQPFVQLQAGRDSHQGTGLGLAISQQFAQLMGGKITAESSPEGSRFQLTIVVETTADLTPVQVCGPTPLVDASDLLPAPSLGPSNLHAQMQAQPLPWRRALQQAAISAREPALVELIGQLNGRYGPLQQELHTLVHQLAFDDIAALVAGTVEQDSG